MAEITLEFSGDDQFLKQSIEQSIAAYEMLRQINFDRWFNEWEQGFVTYTQNRGAGNYRLDGATPWRNDPSKRPRFRDWMNEEQRLRLPYRTIEYWPDRENETESYVLSGTPNELINHIIQLEYTGKSDALGGWLGYPYEEFVYKNPAPLQIQIHLRLTEKPPWEPQALLDSLNLNRRTPPRPYVTIPNVNRALLTWQNVKTACGGSNGYRWGPHYAVCRLGDKTDEKLGKGGALKVYADSENDAIERAEAFAALSQSPILTMTAGEERQDKGVRATDTNMQKPNVQIFPAWFTIFNYKLVAGAVKGPGTGTVAGRKLEKQKTIELWYPQEPAGMAELIADLTSSSFD